MSSSEPPRHPWEEWTWDESVFEGTARYYTRGRSPYAPGLAKAVGDALQLDGHGRLLDIGCGPGSVTILFAPLFEEAVGLDSDPGMIEAAMVAADQARVHNIVWEHMRAEDLPNRLGSFRTISFAQSFHWMDRPKVAFATRQMLEPCGAVVQVDLWHRTPAELLRPGRCPPIPQGAIDELRVRWLGPDRRAGQGFRNTSPSEEDDVFQAAGFRPEQVVVVPDERILERSVDDVVAWVLSTSSTAPHLFGAELSEFEHELRAVLRQHSPEGKFSVSLSDNRIRIRRPR